MPGAGMGALEQLAHRIAVAHVDVAIAAEQVRQAAVRLTRAQAELERLERTTTSPPAVEDDTIRGGAEKTTTPAVPSNPPSDGPAPRPPEHEPRGAASDELTIVHELHAGPNVDDQPADDETEQDWLSRHEDDPRNVLRELTDVVFDDRDL